jgi:hypothetical protein
MEEADTQCPICLEPLFGSGMSSDDKSGLAIQSKECGHFVCGHGSWLLTYSSCKSLPQKADRPTDRPTDSLAEDGSNDPSAKGKRPLMHGNQF